MSYKSSDMLTAFLHIFNLLTSHPKGTGPLCRSCGMAQFRKNDKVSSGDTATQEKLSNSQHATPLSQAFKVQNNSEAPAVPTVRSEFKILCGH